MYTQYGDFSLEGRSNAVRETYKDRILAYTHEAMSILIFSQAFLIIKTSWL